MTSCISSPKIVGESVRKRAVAKSRYNRTGGPCSRGTRISVFWCVDPFRDFHPSAREILSRAFLFFLFFLIFISSSDRNLIQNRNWNYDYGRRYLVPFSFENKEEKEKRS